MGIKTSNMGSDNTFSEEYFNPNWEIIDISKPTTGAISFPEDIVKYNKMGWSQFDFFEYELKHLIGRGSGWYVWALHDGLYYYRWVLGDNGRFLSGYLKGGFKLAQFAI